MKLDRLTSSTAQSVATEYSHGQKDVPIQPVEGSEAASPDRRHSLRQDLEEIEAQAMAPFEGQELIHQQAHEVAEKLASLGRNASKLVKNKGSKTLWHMVDDEA